MCEIAGKTIAVTGAAGNLGAATARLLAARGAKLLLLDRSEAHVREALGDAASAPAARVVTADVTDEAAVLRATEAAERDLGPLVGLVCTVGGYKGGADIVASDWSDWEAMLLINLKSAVACTRAALRAMVPRGAGSIVHVASLAALGPSPGEAAYASAKAAVLSFSQSVAAEVKGAGVRVNAILPGTMDTPQNRAWMSGDAAAKAVDPAAAADVALFLLSEAARAVTGAAIRVTGRQ